MRIRLIMPMLGWFETSIDSVFGFHYVRLPGDKLIQLRELTLDWEYLK